MTRMIRIENCDACPHSDHKGGFGHVAYIPVCSKESRTLPYTEHASRGRIIAHGTDKIPSWCPLEKVKES